MNNNMDIGEIICESVDTIVTERLRTVNFDATITCTIVDDSQKEQGTYIVTDGSTRFTAYTTDTKLKNNQQVYVTIPNNDYSEQKMIIGKKTTENANEPYIYNSPFNNFVKGSNNLVISTSNAYYGLTANSHYKPDSNIEKQPTTIITIPVVDILPTTEIPFTRIGLKANFKTLLPSNTTQGNYGLRIVPKTNNNESEPATLDCNDFYGNPYQFFNYINQEQVFIIPPTWKQINEITLQFFQDNNFNLEQPEAIDEDLSWIEDSIGESITNDNNIFVSGIELYLGYDINDFDKDNFQIYSIDNSYNYNNINGIQTEKTLKGEWVFIGEDSENSKIVSADALPYNKETYNPLKKNILLSNNKYINMYCWEKGKNSAGRMTYQGVRWYRQKYGASKPDEYAGSGWEILDPVKGENELYYFNSPLELKVFLRTNNAEENYKCIIFDNIIFTQPDLENKENIENIEIYENIEQVEKPLCINSCTPIVSNIINFINSNYEKTTSINKQTQLAIITTDSEDGSYYYYNLLGDIENTNWSSVSRTLELYYESAQLNQSSKCKVEWTIPIMHTMFQAANFKVLGMNLDEINTGDKKNWINVQNLNQQKNPTASINDVFYKRITIDNLNGEATDLLNNPFVLTYQISQKYNQTKINNNIDCKLYYLNDEIPYTTSRRFNFGISNTSGTEIAFQLQCVELDANDNTIGYQPIIKLNQEIQRFQIIPRIVVGKTNQQLNPADFNIEYSWYKRNKGDIPICVNVDNSYIKEDNNYILQIDKKEDVNLEDYLVLQAIMPYGEYQNLTAYLSFAFSGKVNDNDYAEIPEGTFEIIYDSASGLPFKDYEISYRIDNTIEDNVRWRTYKMPLRTSEEKQNPIEISNDGQDPYYPIITSIQNNSNVLMPASFYSEELEPISVRALGLEEEIYWSQPLLILKNRFPNSIINKWQENLFIDEENNTILSAMMVAGSKDVENKFSGVIMGAIKGESDSSLSQHGLYGYEAGQQTFAFKGDGIAFLGKNGRGQIIFEGDKGIIKSGKVEEDKDLYTGIKIDLDGEEDKKSPYINLQSINEIMGEEQIAFQTELKPEGLFVKRGKIQLTTTLPNNDKLTHILPEATLLDIDEEKVKIPQLLVKENLGVSGSRITNTKNLNTETNINTLIDYAIEMDKYILYIPYMEAFIETIIHIYDNPYYKNFVKKETKSNNIIIYGFNNKGLINAKGTDNLKEFVGEMRSVYKNLYEDTEEWGPDNFDPDPSNILRSWVDLSQIQNYTFIEKYYDNLSTHIKYIYVFRDLFKFRKYYDGEVKIDELVFNEDLNSPQNDDLVFCPLPNNNNEIEMNKIFNLSLISQVGNIWRPNLIEEKE